MISRFISALLIASYAASQMAALPHAHASEPPGHGGRAHVHGVALSDLLGGDSHSHDHDHHHAHRHSSHTHCNPEPSPLPAVPNEHGHDDNCVYLPDVNSSVKQVRAPDWADYSEAAVVWTEILSDGAPPVVPSATQDHASFAMLGDDCALYLTLRTLRI